MRTKMMDYATMSREELIEEIDRKEKLIERLSFRNKNRKRALMQLNRAMTVKHNALVMAIKEARFYKDLIAKSKIAHADG